MESSGRVRHASARHSAATERHHVRRRELVHRPRLDRFEEVGRDGRRLRDRLPRERLPLDVALAGVHPRQRHHLRGHRCRPHGRTPVDDRLPHRDARFRGVAHGVRGRSASTLDVRSAVRLSRAAHRVLGSAARGRSADARHGARHRVPLRDRRQRDHLPSDIGFYSHWIATIPWLWFGGGVAALAVGAARRHGGVSGWLGITSTILGAQTLLLAIAPLQYMAAGPGALWLLIAAIGFSAESRTQPGSRC